MPSIILQGLSCSVSFIRQGTSRDSTCCGWTCYDPVWQFLVCLNCWIVKVEHWIREYQSSREEEGGEGKEIKYHSPSHLKNPTYSLFSTSMTTLQIWYAHEEICLNKWYEAQPSYFLSHLDSVVSKLYSSCLGKCFAEIVRLCCCPRRLQQRFSLHCTLLENHLFIILFY